MINLKEYVNIDISTLLINIISYIIVKNIRNILKKKKLENLIRKINILKEEVIKGFIELRNEKNIFSKEFLQKIVRISFILGKVVFIIITIISIIILIFTYLVNENNNNKKNFDYLTLYIGITSLILPIYMYALSLGNSFKKYILTYLIGEANILYIFLGIFVLYFFKVPEIYYLSLFILICWEMIKIINWIFITNTKSKFEKNIPKIIKEFKKYDREDGLEDLYYELKKSLFLFFSNKNYVEFEESLNFYIQLLKEDKIKNLKVDLSKNQDEQKDEFDAVKTFYELYNLLMLEENVIFEKLLKHSTLEIAESYVENNKDLDMALRYYNFLILRYDYLKKYNKEIDWTFLDGYKFRNYELGGLQRYRAILNVLNECIIKNQKDDFEYIANFFSGETVENMYINLLLIFLLEKNGINCDEWNKKLKENLDESFYNDYEENEIIIELYRKIQNLNEEFRIEEFLYGKTDIKGMSNIVVFSDSVIEDLMLELLPDCCWFIEKFIKENYENLKYKQGIEKVKKWFQDMKDIINELKLNEKKINLSKEEIDKICFEKSNIKTSCENFIEKHIAKAEIIKVPINEEIGILKEKFRGYNVCLNKKVILNSNIIDQYINLQEEYFFVENCLKYKERKSFSKFKEIISKNEYVLVFDREDIKKVEEIRKLLKFENCYILKNYRGLKNPLLIEKKSLLFILEFLPKDYKNGTAAYIEINNISEEEIKKETNIEKKIELKNSLLLKIFKYNEYSFKEDAKIYELID